MNAKIRIALLAALVVAAMELYAMSAHAATVIPVDQDVMTSGFFTGENLVRGYPGDARPVHRVSTDAPFGVAAETVYLTFDYEFQDAFDGPVTEAILRVESVSGGFGADASEEMPFLMSAHGVTADPLASITDDTNPGGPISFTDFYGNNIMAASGAAQTMVTGFGTLEFDVTELVNSWVDGTNTVHAIALTGLNDTSGNDFLHGIANNSETVGLSHSLTVVPEPSGLALAGFATVGLLLGWLARRRAWRWSARTPTCRTCRSTRISPPSN
jgi:hypothetical protein